MYLVEAHFKDDAERRRIEYILKKYQEDVVRASGMTIYIKNDEVLEPFLVELRSKLMDENIQVYKLDSTEVEVRPESREIKMDFKQKPHSVNAFMGYFVSKRGGELKQQLPGYHRWYQILTRKGKVDMEVEVTTDSKTHLRASLEGFEPALSIIAAELEKDLRHYKEGGMSF